MIAFPEPGRQVGHVLLDAVIAGDEASGADIVNLALRRIDDIDGAVVSRDGELDLSHVAGGALITLDRVVRLLAEERQVSIDVVVSEIRSYLDISDL